jgi:hypothetical protein
MYALFNGIISVTLHLPYLETNSSRSSTWWRIQNRIYKYNAQKDAMLKLVGGTEVTRSNAMFHPPFHTSNPFKSAMSPMKGLSDCAVIVCSWKLGGLVVAQPLSTAVWA